MSLLCLVGRHAGYWSYADPADRHSCRQFRLCQRKDCHATEDRVWHDFQIPADGRVRYVTEDECWAQGACTRCGMFGGITREIHRWGDFQTDWNGDGEMIKIRHCLHCPGYQERTAVYVD